MSLDNTGATLTRRVHQNDAKRSRSTTASGRSPTARTTPFPGKPNAGKVCLDGGFDTNHIYELVYTAKNPTVAGIGFAATRDFAAFLRGDGAADRGSGQSGRGRHRQRDDLRLVAERPLDPHLHPARLQRERKPTRVFEGAIPHKASNRGAFNVRLAQPNRLSGTQHTEAQYPGQESPQTWDVSTDPIAGVTGGPVGALPQVANLPEDHRDRSPTPNTGRR